MDRVTSFLSFIFVFLVSWRFSPSVGLQDGGQKLGMRQTVILVLNLAGYGT